MSTYEQPRDPNRAPAVEQSMDMVRVGEFVHHGRRWKMFAEVKDYPEPRIARGEQ